VTRRDAVCLSIGALLEAACYLVGRLLGRAAVRWL
jgi:hypothetical protein